MGDIRLNTAFIVLLVITLILFTLYYILFSIETEEKDYGGLKEITGKVRSFEVSHDEANFHIPTKRVSERYDDKYFEYLWNRYELTVKSEKEKHEEEKEKLRIVKSAEKQLLQFSPSRDGPSN